jgi:hypothetical protein
MVTGSILKEVAGFFNLPNPFIRTVAMGSTQRNEYQESSCEWGIQPHRHLWANCLENVTASTSHNPMGLHGLLQG